MVAVEVIAILAAGVLSRYVPQYEHLPAAYHSHVSILTLVTIALFVMAELWPRPPIVLTLLFFELIYWYFLHYPLSSATLVPLLAASALILRAWRGTPVGTATGVTVVLVLLVVQGRAGGIAWDGVVSEKHAAAVTAESAILILVSGLAGMLRRTIDEFEQFSNRQQHLSSTIDHLTVANVGFQRVVQDIAEKTKQEERERITRDIHDSIGYTVSNLIVMLDAATGLVRSDPDRAIEIMQSARTQADRGHGEIRRALHILRTLQDTDIYGLRNLDRITSAFSDATGVDVTVDFGNLKHRYDGMIESAIYRFVQEGMANAFRHGKATRIESRMFQTEREIVVSVEDNGLGAEEIVEGIGIVGMRERLCQVDGTISFESNSQGFRITARIPNNSEPAHASAMQRMQHD